jgi:uncharacterized protein (TIGR03435 family)
MNSYRHFFAIASLLVAGIASAQPQFDVASIKPNLVAGKFTGIDDSRGYWKAQNVTVKFLIMYAYQLLPDQIAGAAPWVDAERFDIEARYEEDPNASNANAERNRARLQALLATRFQFQMHRQTREWQTYVLVASKKGAKLKPTERAKGTSMHSNNGHLEAAGASMNDLARGLGSRLGRPVVNETGLEGRFDFTLDYEPEIQLSLDKDKPEAPGSEPGRPSLFTALQDQLGLKLQSKKAPVEMLIVDRIAKPSEN